MLFVEKNRKLKSEIRCEKIHRWKKLISHKNNGILKKKCRRGIFVYETICYVCVALAIAIKSDGCCV